MKLSMELIMDNMLHSTNVVKSEHWEDSSFNLTAWELLTNCTSANNAVLLIAEASAYGLDELPENTPLFLAGSYTGHKCFTRMLSCPDCDLSTLIGKINHIFFQCRTMENAFHKAIHVDYDMQKILDTAVPLMFSNLVLSTMDFRTICHSANIESFWPGFDVNEQNNTMTESMSNDPNFDRVRTIREPFSYNMDEFHIHCLCYNIFCNDELTFRLVYNFKDSKPRTMDSLMLSYLGNMIGSIYERIEGTSPLYPKSHLQDIMCRLGAGQPVEHSDVEKALGYRTWNVADCYLCISILPGSHNTKGYHYYGKKLVQHINGLLYFVEEPYIFCIINLQYYDNNERLFMEKNVEFLRDYILRAGFSNPYHSFYDLKYHKTQALIALDVGMNYYPTAWYYRYKKCAVDYLIKKGLESLDPNHFIMPELLQLKQYDEIQDTEYVHTLKKYLENNQNVLKTSRDLSIVRGTMNFRLGRIQEMTGLDLKNRDTLLYLELSFKMLSRL